MKTTFSPPHGLRNATKLTVFCCFPNYEFLCPKHHSCKPDMKPHEKKHYIIHSSPNMKPPTQCETMALLSFISMGFKLSPDTKHTQHKQHHLWGAAGRNNNVVSCGVWLHRGLWSCDVSPKPRCLKPGHCNVYSLLRSLAPFRALSRTCVCALLRSFALICALWRLSTSDHV